MDLLTFLVLLRVPILNNHVLNWVALLIVAWVTQRKIVPTRKNLLSVPLRITTALVALWFLIGLAQITFDPFWIVHIGILRYLGNIPYANFFYTGLVCGIIFFRFDLRKVWVLFLPIGVSFVWFMLGFHLPADMGIWYTDLTANLFDILEQVAGYVAGYYLIKGFRFFQ